MPMKYPEEFIIQTVKQFEAGTSIKELSRSLKIAPSTLYRWVRAYKTIPRKEGECPTGGFLCKTGMAGMVTVFRDGSHRFGTHLIFHF